MPSAPEPVRKGDGGRDARRREKEKKEDSQCSDGQKKYLMIVASTVP